MKKQIVVYSLALALVVLGLAGTAFAHWTKMITVEGHVTTGTVDWEWTSDYSTSDVGIDWWMDPINPSGVPEQGDKDVGWAEMDLQDHRVKLYLGNIYPGYSTEVTLHAHYKGSVPGIVRSILLKDSSGAVIADLSAVYEPIILKDGDLEVFRIDWNENPFPQLHYCKTWEISFYITALEDIVMDKYDTACAEYYYYIEWEVINYNEWPTPCEYLPDPTYVPPQER